MLGAAAFDQSIKVHSAQACQAPGSCWVHWMEYYQAHQALYGLWHCKPVHQ